MKCDKCWGTGSQIKHAKLGRFVKSLRNRRGLSLKAMSRRMGISDAFLCLLENGKRSWTEELYNKATK